MVTKSTFSDVPNNTASNWWRDDGLRRNVLHCMGCCFCVYYLGYDSSLLNGLQALPQWNEYFHSPSGNLLGLYAASVYLPSLLFAFVGEQISNRYGRRTAICVGTIVLFAGGVFNAFSQNPGQFIGSRVIIGSGGSIAKSHLRDRLHRRTLHPGDVGLEAAVPSPVHRAILVMLFTLTAPESPRYLLKMGKQEKALSVLSKYHANGETDDPLVQWELHEIESALLQEASARSSYLDFFRTPGNLRRLAVILTISVGTNWITSINAGLGAWNLIVAVSAGLNVERFGRRPLFLTSFIGMFCSYAIVMGLSATFATSGNTTAGLAVIPFLFIFYGFYDIALNPLPYPYTAEILPFALRSKGLALFVCVQNVAISFNQFVTPIALAKIQWKYYAVFLCVLLCYILLALLFYRETKGLSLEESAILYDFDKKTARIRVAGVFQEEDVKREIQHVELAETGKPSEA
ncbi:hypothetical protein EHS25_008093 [Saitozyma podzolica]|uniref:Major facilitator superfamily (MFS) profile domain-containing protein n=1 Tax=Saitozyma podzolica TaxID=1890683 RepID=A0A427YNE9_9TREE|nr:hypothetical protein EHS25_008093 [Saitozyma podzolica]